MKKVVLIFIGIILLISSFACAATPAPSLTIVSTPPAHNGKVAIKVGNTRTITGKPLNLPGKAGVDYSRAFFFGHIFDGSLTNDKGDWELTGPAKKEGVSNFHIEIIKDGKTYNSNIIEV